MRHMGGNYVRRLLVMLKLVKMTRVISGGSDRGRTLHQGVGRIVNSSAVEKAPSPAGRIWVYEQAGWPEERHTSLLVRGWPGAVRGLHRCQIRRSAADGAVCACLYNVAGSAAAGAAMEVDGCRRHIRSSGAVGRLFIADSEAIPGSNLRIFPGISHWHRGRLRRRAGAESIRGFVRGEIVRVFRLQRSAFQTGSADVKDR